MDESGFPEELGGFENFKKNINILREKGVDTIPFVTCFSLWSETCDRYGIEGRDGSWAETPKAIAVFATPYLRRHSCNAMGDPSKYPQWKQEVADSFRFLRDKAGCPSISWDQYYLGREAPDETVQNLVNDYRKETYELYPEATFSGKSGWYYESEINNLDFTNSWINDFRPYMYTVDGMRPNMDLNANPLHVKYTFMDNLVAHIYPAKPGDINGSAMISDFPE